MATLQEKREAREWALREVTELIGMALHGYPLAFPHRSNQFASPEKKTLVDIEINRIHWQLIDRLIKNQQKLGMMMQ